MEGAWMLLCATAFITAPAHGTYRYDAWCQCNGKSSSCVFDAAGLRCLNCEGNTEGRRCEDCKEGYYHRKAGDSCLPCHCNTAGSVSPRCASTGHCQCKPGVYGSKCDRCQNGYPITSSGCTNINRNDGLLATEPESLSCFCYGHSTKCSLAAGYSTRTISSTFATGAEGWRAAAVNGVSPLDVIFRWSPKYQDLEVISEDSKPVYLFAPATFLGNQGVSYGQTFSFSLRLDRGVHHPSSSDVVLEGAGLTVAASLGSLDSTLPCGQKTTYTFRLNEHPSSKWQPGLTSFQFQTLLHNITAIKIRVTYGEQSRGYLDDVQLVSAHLAPGAPAGWVENCSCPAGYKGRFCEQCAPGYRRKGVSGGPLSSCEPCRCSGDSCNPETGECYSGDESPEYPCPSGFYQDPLRGFCVKCPCPQGVSCSLSGTSVKCHICPPGTTGPRCSSCDDGFYGDPLGETGPRRACRRCQCSGQVDLNAMGNCDRLTGMCLKCLNNTTGYYCESCRAGFHRSQPQSACKAPACSCNPLGSVSNKCTESGQCSCKSGFDGLTCEPSTCPACFDRVKDKVEEYSRQLYTIKTVLWGTGGTTQSASSADVEKALQTAEGLVAALERNAALLTDSEKDLLARLGASDRIRSGVAEDLQAAARAVDLIRRQNQQYREKVSDIQRYISSIRESLNGARGDINRVAFPSGRTEERNDALDRLAKDAAALAEREQAEAEAVMEVSRKALLEAEKALQLMRSAIAGEKNITKLIGGLKNQYARSTRDVKAMGKQASQLGSSAEMESVRSGEMLDRISALDFSVSQPFKLFQDMDKVAAELDLLEKYVINNQTAFQVLRGDVQAAKTGIEGLLRNGTISKQKYDELLTRANAAQAAADKSLRNINKNVDQVDDVLSKLQGFDDQISSSKAEAEKALKKLESINGTVQDAVSNNTNTLMVVIGVEENFNAALETMGMLTDALAQMDRAPGTLAGATSLLKGTGALRNELDGIKAREEAARDKLTEETELASQRGDMAEQANGEASGAYNNSKMARDAVGRTLSAIDELLTLFGQPGAVDEKKLKQLEGSLNHTRTLVKKQLIPRMQGLEEMESKQNETISKLNTDIDNILLDISNLEQINKTIPVGCFNLPPIERP